MTCDRTTSEADVDAVLLRTGLVSSCGGKIVANNTEGVGGECNDWSDEFVHEMRLQVAINRMRRGRVVWDGSMQTMSPGDEVIRRIELYRESGNEMYLVDAAKYAMWEYIAHKEVLK